MTEDPHAEVRAEAPDATAEVLKSAAEDWSSTFDAMADMVCLLARDGTVLRCNASTTRLLGLEAADVVGKKCYELMHGSTTFFARCPYQEMLRTGERESFELPLGERWYQVTAEPLYGAAGEIVGAVHVVRDITETRASREALTEKSHWLADINALALDLASLARDADVGSFLAGRLRQLTGAAAVAFSEYEPEDKVLATRVIDMLPGTMRTLTAPLLRRIEGTRSPVNDEDYEAIIANASATRATLTEASFGAIPPAVDVAVRKVLGVDRFVGLAYVVEGQLYGTSVIALKAGSPEPPREQLDSISALSAVSLRRRRAERELQATTEELDQLFALSGDMLGIADTSGMIHRVNPAWEVTLGRPVRDFEGRPMLEFLHPDDRESTFAALDELAGGQPVTGFVNRQRHRDGTYRLLEWRVTPQAGGLIFAIGRDITAKVEALEREAALQREAEDQLRRSGAYNRSLIEASLDPLVTIGPDGMITDVNEATVTATGLPREELVGTDFAEYFTEPVRARAGYEQAFREGHVRDYPLEMRHRSGRLTDVLYNASTYSDPEGKVAGVFAAARDIGELKKAEAEIRALNATLEGRVEERTRELAAANTELHEFVYSVSHDLRTPLRAIDGFSQTVLDDYGAVIDEQGRSDLQRVRAAAQRMGELIDALLALSRVGHRDIAPRQVDLTAIARRVIEELREAEPERQVVVAVEEGLLAEADPALADVILENLIGNAWKFTADRPAAHISVGATRDEASRAGAPREFFVRDDGAGFDQTYVDRLFAPFQRLHTAEQFPGTGIGLATVARVLSRIGGTWRAEGTVDEGATFFFTLGDGGDPG